MDWKWLNNWKKEKVKIDKKKKKVRTEFELNEEVRTVKERLHEINFSTIVGGFLLIDISVLILAFVFVPSIIKFDMTSAEALLLSLVKVVAAFACMIVTILLNTFFLKRYFIIRSKLKNKIRLVKMEKEGEVEGKESEKVKIKRMGWFRRLLFWWRTYNAKIKLQEYEDKVNKIRRMIGKVRTEESKNLEKVKNNMIASILGWQEDFQITYIINKGNNLVDTGVPVDEEGLKRLPFDEIDKSYFVRSILLSDNFINGGVKEEKDLIK